MTRIANFDKLIWRRAAILKIITSLYLICSSSNFDEIWYIDANIDLIENGRLKKIKILQTQDGGWVPS